MGAASHQTLRVEDVDAIAANCNLVNYVSPVDQKRVQAVYGSQNWNTMVMGVRNDYFAIRSLTIAQGSNFTSIDDRASAKVCVVGITVVFNLFGDEKANPVGEIIRVNSIPVKIIGVLSKLGQNTFGQDQDDIILAPYTTVQKRIMAITYLQNIYASAVDEKSSADATKEISAILRENHQLKTGEDDDFSVRTQAELISTMSSTSQLLTVLLTAIAAISLLVGGIGIMNIMYVSVTERTREIGLRMAIGARGIDILLQFLTEAILISVTGGLLGVVLGITAAKLVTFFLSWPTLVSQSSVILSFVICSVTGVFFGFYPAQKASRLDPIDALRYE